MDSNSFDSRLAKRPIIAWAIYDWANSAFSTVILTFVFAAYFTRKIAINEIVGTELWGYAVALAGIFIVILSPIFGAIADHGGRRKPWLGIFTLVTITASALLWYAKPYHNYVHLTLFFLILGIIGVEISQVFYNALLPSLAPPKYFGRISGWGWGMGYAGGLTALIVCLFGFIQTEPSWLNTATAEHVRICGPLVALWVAVFAIPLFFYVPDYPATGLTSRQAIAQGFSALITTLKTLPKQKNIFIFLIARMIYLDGLNTVFAFGGIYAAGTFGMDIAQVTQFGIAMNIAAGLGAAGFAWIDDLIGAKRTILIALVFLTLLGGAIVLAKTKLWFWIFAFILSLFFGPVQAASRSLMARIVPREKITEMFGLYTLSGKVTAFIGPWLLAFVTAHYQSQRAGIATVVFFFVIGAILLLKVQEK